MVKLIDSCFGVPWLDGS